MRLMITGAVVLFAVWTAAVPASSQNAPLTGRDVVGSWKLQFVPTERRGVTVRSTNGPPEMLLAVAARDRGLACMVEDEAADCAIRNGALVVTWVQSKAAMTFRIAGRTRDGFSGTARMRARLLPFSVDIGAVNMVRATAR